MQPLGTYEHPHQLMRERLAAINARLDQINARRDELVTLHPGLKAVT